MINRQSGAITHSVVRELCNFVPPNYAFIFNDTKVFKARLFGRKESGGKTEILIIRDTPNGVLAQVKGGAKNRLIFEADLSARVLNCGLNGERYLQFFERDQPIDFARLTAICELIGVVPLPPYIKRSAVGADSERYQSQFAAHSGSVAAPTASLHFDEPLLERIRADYEHAFLTLHIGLGTFKSVETSDIRSHKMHSEYFAVSPAAERLIASEKPLIAVGTTACRTVEFYARTGRTSGECDLFLHPANMPVRVNALMTNFHLPKSTLLMLVASFLGLERTRLLYAEAIAHNYRFYSYGDAMLIV